MRIGNETYFINLHGGAGLAWYVGGGIVALAVLLLMARALRRR